jgi:hypothetical protein
LRGSHTKQFDSNPHRSFVNASNVFLRTSTATGRHETRRHAAAFPGGKGTGQCRVLFDHGTNPPARSD